MTKKKILKEATEKETLHTGEQRKELQQNQCKPEDNEVTSLKCSKKNKTAYKK